jgi:uncharacterized protein YkwD
MHARLFIPLLLLLVPGWIAAATQWNRDSYKTVTHKNFRTNAAFNAKIDLGNIDYPLLNAAIFYLTNEQRAKKGKKPLEYHSALEIAAWNHSASMARKNFFSHDNHKEKNRRDSDDRGKLAGIANPSIAENIAYSDGENEDATYMEIAVMFIETWMDSPGHKENILSGDALQLGCGAYYLDGTWYGTQNFQWFEKIKAGKAIDKLPQ